jgi:hypothetical protein
MSKRKTIWLGNQVLAVIERKGNTVDIEFKDDIKVDRIITVIQKDKDDDYNAEFEDDEDEDVGEYIEEDDEDEDGNG